VRFWFDDEDPERRRKVARTTTGTVLLTTTVAALLGLLVAGSLSDLLLDERDAVLMGFGLLGLWAFTNLEIAYALLRVEERRREYFMTSLFNVLLTVALTFVLVVVLDTGARGYVAGNYVASRSCCSACGGACATGSGRPPAAWRRCCASACRPSRPTWRSSRST
jgi:O-antigen/teichoic acid export membrane protein